MIRRGLTGAALALLLPLAVAAEEPVLRVVDAKASASAPLLLEHKCPSDPTWFSAFVGTKGAVKDRFRTGSSTSALLEFFIGGRVGIAPGSEIEVISETRIGDANRSLKRVVLSSGSIWFKSAKLRQPLEIQTQTGLMGIKGTEFTVEASPDTTQLSVLDGSVEVRSSERKFVALAAPGDVYQLNSGPTPVYQHKDPAVLRQEIEQGPLGQALQSIQEELQGLRQDMTRVGSQLDQLLGLLETGPKVARPFKVALESSAFPSRPDMSPNQVAGVAPVFSWAADPQADGYVMLLAADSKFDQIIFSTRSRDHQLAYPASARPLAAGTYFWRIVPVDVQDQPLPGCGQAFFRVEGTRPL